MQLFCFIYFQSALYVSGDVFAHHQEHMTVITASGIEYWVEPNTQLQPAVTSVDNTRSCNYSDMLLMMGENIARNM